MSASTVSQPPIVRNMRLKSFHYNTNASLLWKDPRFVQHLENQTDELSLGLRFNDSLCIIHTRSIVQLIRE
jgi:hypothetical protein